MKDSDTFKHGYRKKTKMGVPTWGTFVKALRDCKVNQIGVAERIEMDRLLLNNRKQQAFSCASHSDIKFTPTVHFSAGFSRSTSLSMK